MDEFELVRRYFERSSSDDSVRLGIGDDGAVIAPDRDRHLISVVDTIIAGVHYPADLPPVDVGYRSLAVNLSDIAAMGGRPRWMTLALSIPHAEEAWLADFADGLFAAAAVCAVSLVGGDTTRGDSTVVSVHVMGDIDPHAVIKRSGAHPGEGVFVTGTPGDAAAGLELLQRGADREGDRRYLIGRFVRPEIRVTFAASIAKSISAAIDLSDGLYADLQKLLTASGVGAVVEIDRLPLSSEISAAVGDDEAVKYALGGGDDYELCFTAPDSIAADIRAVAKEHGVQVTRIGEVVAGQGIVCTKAGEPVDYTHPGYRHF